MGSTNAALNPLMKGGSTQAALNPPNKALTIMTLNFLNMYRISKIIAPFERGDSGVCNGAKIVKIRYVLRKLGPKVIGAFLGPDRKNRCLKMRFKKIVKRT